jgi:hypothetical protein
MRSAGWITQFVDRVSIGKLAQTDEFLDLLPPVQLHIGWSIGEQNAAQLTMAKQAIELGCRDIDQEQNEYPKLDRDKAVPGKFRDLVL